VTTQERAPSAEQLRRYRQYLLAEWEAAALYRRLADLEKDGNRAGVFRELAAMEDKHAARWQSCLEAANEPLPTWRPSLRSRALGWLARIGGGNSVIPILERAEASDENMYALDPEAQDFSQDEELHGRIFGRLLRGDTTISTSRLLRPDQIAAREKRHRSDQGGGLRAGVFGINDGLLSNLSLVMGVAGSGTGQGNIILAGLAGLLAGAFSMAIGEYLSMSVQRELYERDISIERAELEEDPEEERQELELIYRAKGLSPDEAHNVSHRIIGNKETALDTLAREELGLDPDELGSPITAAVSSFLTFAIGAFIPVFPFLVLSGEAAFFTSLVLGIVAIGVVGVVTSILTGRSPVRGALRQIGLSVVAAAVTFSVGRLLGVAVGG
jgi:VIT1/CCC1 family predicted Fe2+/Mn2+ transporter